MEQKQRKVLRYHRLFLPEREIRGKNGLHWILLNIEAFSSFFLPGWKLIPDPTAADIVFVPYRGRKSPSPYYRYYSFLVREKFGFRPLICFWNNEPQLQKHPNENADYTFGFRPTSDRNCQILHFSSLLDMGFNPLENANREWHAPRLDPLRKVTKFCHFIYENRRIIKRQDFSRALTKYKRVDSYGRVLNNMPRIPPRPEPDRLDWFRYYNGKGDTPRRLPGMEDKLRVMRGYKWDLYTICPRL